MQDRYAGDVGDYVKLALLRHLGDGRKLGVAWYLHPDEEHNADGRHVSYLSAPKKWRHLDPELFDSLKQLVVARRDVSALQETCVPPAAFAGERLVTGFMEWRLRSEWRTGWFSRVVHALEACDLVFADPDNGLVDDRVARRSRKVFAKQMPLREASVLANGRAAILYHHNTRRKGGHDLEVEHWLGELGPGTIAIRANAFSCRTFFILNADSEMRGRANSFCQRWKMASVRLHE